MSQMYMCSRCGKTHWEDRVPTECLENTCTVDMINSPPHYHKGGIDVLTFLKDKLTKEQWEAVHQFNIIKYVTRFNEKNGLQDLEKASFYLNKLIELKKAP